MSLLELFGHSHVRLYALLAVARVLFAFAGTGYIHPDEYFQNGEITAGSVLGLHTLKTWEWDPSFPCRSIYSPMVSTGAAFAVLNKLISRPSPAHIFYAERAICLIYSFFMDGCMHSLVPQQPWLALILLGSSHVIFTFQLRPFSNSGEALSLVFVLLQLYKLLQSTDEISFRLKLSNLAILVVEGMFIRMTFPAFVAPVALEAITELVRRSRREGCIKLSSVFGMSLLPMLATIAAYVFLVLLDTIYFTGGTEHPILTPYNFLLYNLSSENLAQHGLHPRWLHVAVNLPMILGPPLFVAGVYACWRVIQGGQAVKENPSGGPHARTNRVCAWIIVSALVLLSFQPHQEPRFLVPLVFPTVLLVANSGVIDKLGRLFWVTTAISNFALAVLFGVLHQGGVVPSLFRVHELMQQTNHSSAIVYWKTYMPPRHLLAIPEADVQSGLVSVIDLAGADADEVSNILSSLPTGDASTDLYLVTPPFAVRGLDRRLADCLELDKRIYPHLDLDHIPESVEMGWQEGLSLGIYLGEVECLKRAAHSVA